MSTQQGALQGDRGNDGRGCAVTWWVPLSCEHLQNPMLTHPEMMTFLVESTQSWRSTPFLSLAA